MNKTAVAISLAVTLAVPVAARAQSTGAVAEQLFRDASARLKEGKTHEACLKFAESQKLDPQLGTLLNLAACHEKEGKMATAWGEYNELVDQASKLGDAKRLDYAKNRAADVEKKMPRLQLYVPTGTSELKIDGQAMGEAAWTTVLPIDAGDHKITYAAPGKEPRSQSVTVAPGGVTTQAALAPFVDSPPSAAVAQPAPSPVRIPAATPAEPKRGGSGLRTVGYAVAGAGVVGVGVGGVFGAIALGAKGNVTSNCGSAAGLADNLCNQTGFDAQKQARTNATISTISFVVGGVALASGVAILLFGTPPPSAANATARRMRHHGFLAPTLGGFVAGGTF
jgi:hypothetical protein